MSSAAIVTRGLLFTPSLIVTAGLYGGAVVPPTPVVTRNYGGGIPTPKKKKKRKEYAWSEAGITPKQSLEAILFNMQEADDEEDLLTLMRFD